MNILIILRGSIIGLFPASIGPRKKKAILGLRYNYFGQLEWDGIIAVILIIESETIFGLSHNKMLGR